MSSLAKARPSPPRGGLSRRKLRVLRAVAEAQFYDGERPPPAERLDWLMVELDDFVAAAAGATRLVVGLAVWVLQLSPLLMLRRFRRFSGLPVERRVECLRRLDASRFGLFALLFSVSKIMLAMLYFEHPEALAETGYDGQCLLGANPVPGLPAEAVEAQTP